MFFFVYNDDILIILFNKIKRTCLDYFITSIININKMKTIVYIFIVSGVLSIMCLIIELAATEAIQSSSDDYIHWLQTNNKSAAENFFKVISSGAEYFAMGIGFIIYIPNQHKLGLLCIFITFFSTWLGDVLKMLIAHSRPFWEYSEIKGMMCATDFGAPSGHALTVGSVIILLYFYFFNKAKVITTLAAGLLLALIALDRNYLGVHYYFQVILGYVIAIWVVSGFIMSNITKWIKSLSENIYKLCIIETLFLFGLLLSVLIYFIRDPQFEDKWKTNYSNDCNGPFNKDSTLFKSLVESTCLLILSGFLLGMKMQKHVSINYSWKYYTVVYVLFIIFIIIEQVFEMLAGTLSYTANFLIFCLLRFLSGFVVAAGIPFIISFFF